MKDKIVYIIISILFVILIGIGFFSNPKFEKHKNNVGIHTPVLEYGFSGTASHPEIEIDVLENKSIEGSLTVTLALEKGKKCTYDVLFAFENEKYDFNGKEDFYIKTPGVDNELTLKVYKNDGNSKDELGEFIKELDLGNEKLIEKDIGEKKAGVIPLIKGEIIESSDSKNPTEIIWKYEVNFKAAGQSHLLGKTFEFALIVDSDSLECDE